MPCKGLCSTLTVVGVAVSDRGWCQASRRFVAGLLFGHVFGRVRAKEPCLFCRFPISVPRLPSLERPRTGLCRPRGGKKEFALYHDRPRLGLRYILEYNKMHAVVGELPTGWLAHLHSTQLPPRINAQSVSRELITATSTRRAPPPARGAPPPPPPAATALQPSPPLG